MTVRNRWWTDETTRFVRETRLVCARCGEDAGYGKYGDGYRCHACGRLVEGVLEDRDLGDETDGC